MLQPADRPYLDIRNMQHKHVEVIKREWTYLRLSLPPSKGHSFPITTMPWAVKVYERIRRRQVLEFGSHPKVLEAGLKIIQSAKNQGLKAGVYLNDVAAAEYWLDYNLDFYALSIDYKILAQAYRASFKNWVQITSKT